MSSLSHVKSSAIDNPLPAYPFIFDIKCEVNGGKLAHLELGDIHGFGFERIYYLFDMNDQEVRGDHCHKILSQLVIVLRGSCKVELESKGIFYSFNLDLPTRALYIPKGFYRRLSQFSADALCLVLASDRYNEHDYIRGHDSFLTWQETQSIISSVPYLTLDREYGERRSCFDIAYFDTMKSGQFILGTEVENFEARFSSFIGVRYGISVGNGFDGLLLVLQAWGVGADDEVIVPAHTFIATALAASRLGAKIELVDVDPSTHQLDLESLEAKITKRTKVVIPVHMHGSMCPIEGVLELCKKNSLFVLEDASQALTLPPSLVQF